MSTKDRIVERALAEFNKRGIEYVGLRELAGMLDMRVSNINYYFPTKDDLVFELSVRLNNANSEVFYEDRNVTLKSFLDMLDKVFVNHQKYRCLLLSFVHLMERNPRIAARYAQTNMDRNKTMRYLIKRMVTRKEIRKTKTEVDQSVAMIGLIVRFWISEVQITKSDLNEEKQRQEYLDLIKSILVK